MNEAQFKIRIGLQSFVEVRRINYIFFPRLCKTLWELDLGIEYIIDHCGLHNVCFCDELMIFN